MEERRLLKKRAELLALDHLLRLGIDPLTPVSGEGLVVVPLQNGGYREALVVAGAGPSPRWFRVFNLRPRHGLVIVCMALQGEHVETWVIPSLVYAEQAERSDDAYEVNLDTGRQAQALEAYRDAWQHLTQDALRSRERPGTR